MTKYHNIPQPMRDCKQWMLAGADKHPVAVNLGDMSTYRGSKNNPDQWLTFGDACYFGDELGFEIAFVTLPSDPFTIIDLDHKADKVYDADAIELKSGLYQQAVNETYTELSRSGKGVHIVIAGKLAHDFNAQNAGVECYGNKGFVLITGNQVSKTNVIAPHQDWLDYLSSKYPRAIDDAQFADTTLDRAQIEHPSAEELALDDQFATWIDSWRNKDTVDGWMQDREGDDRSTIDMKVMQLFVKFTRERKHPDESAVRMFLRSPRAKLLSRKQDVAQYLRRTLVGAKARVALDDRRAKDFDMGEGSRAMLADYLAKMKPAELAAPMAEGQAPINMGGMGSRPPAMAAEAPFTGFKWLSKSDLENQPKLEWAVKGLFPTKGVGAIYGESGAGKSFVAIDLVAAIAEGRKWFNLRTKQLPVSVFALEGEGGLKGRVRAWEMVNKRDYPESVFFWDGAHNGTFALRDGSPDPSNKDSNKKRLIQLCADLIANGRRGGVVVIDTLNQASDGADENSSRDMGELLRAMKFIQRETDSLVLIVHHATKSKENQSMRGHSSLYGAMDGIMEVLRTVTNDNGDLIENRRGWKAVKVKDGRDGYEKVFDMKEVQVDMDEDGPVFSVAIEPVQDCIVDMESGEVQQINVGTIGAKPAQPKSRKQAREMREAPPVTRAGVQNAPTWNASERSAPIANRSPDPTPPLSSKQFGERINGGKNQRIILDAILNDSTRAGSAGKNGAAPGVPAAPASAAVDEAIRLRPDAGDPTQLKRDMKKAIQQMIDAGKLGSRNIEVGGGKNEWIQWIFPIS